MTRGVIPRAVEVLSRGVGVVRPGPRAGLRILLYHSVGGSEDSVSPAAFRGQMRWLREESGGTITSLSSGARALKDGDLEGAAVAVTFDDGYRDTLTVAAPILLEYRIPFTTFLVGEFLSDSSRGGIYLDGAGVRELLSVRGADVGAHGYTHRPLSKLTDADLREELERSAGVIGEVTGRRPSGMSYPHGAVDERVIRRAAEAGFVFGASSRYGVNRPGVFLLRLRRTEVAPGDSLESFKGKVRGYFDWYGIKQKVYWPLPRAGNERGRPGPVHRDRQARE